MTFEGLLRLVRETVIDDEKMDAFAARLKAADEEFENTSRKKMVTEDLLSRACSL